MSAEDFRIVQTVIGALGLILLFGYVVNTYRLFKANRDANVLFEQDIAARTRPWIGIGQFEQDSVDLSGWVVPVINHGGGIANPVTLSITRNIQGIPGGGSQPILGQVQSFPIMPGETRPIKIRFDDFAQQALQSPSTDASFSLEFDLRYEWTSPIGPSVDTLLLSFGWNFSGQWWDLRE